MRMLLIAALVAMLSAPVWTGEKKGGASGGKSASAGKGAKNDKDGDDQGQDKAKDNDKNRGTPPPGDKNRGDDKGGDRGRDGGKPGGDNKGADDGRDKDKGRGRDGDGKDGKGKDMDKIVQGRRIPPGIARQGDEKIEKWLGSRGQMKKDLDDIYDRDARKRLDRDRRQGYADSLYDALTDRGMDSERARNFIRNMAASRDKDDAYSEVAKAIAEAAGSGKKDPEIVADVESIVNGADSAVNIGKGLNNWLRKK